MKDQFLARRRLLMAAAALVGHQALAQVPFIAIPEEEYDPGDFLDQSDRNKRRLFQEALMGIESKGVALGRVKLPIRFGNGRSDVDTRVRRGLLNVAQVLNEGALGRYHLLIEGHANATGSRDLNLSLTRKRAQTVSDILVSYGVEPRSLRTQGYGFDRPETCRDPRDPLNRRVELWIVRPEADIKHPELLGDC